MAIPRLPEPPKEYSAEFIRQYSRILNTYMVQDSAEDDAALSTGEIDVPWSTVVAGALALDADDGNTFVVGPLQGNITTFSLVNALTTAGALGGVVLNVFFIQDGIGSRTVTWPSGSADGSFKWAGGTPGTLSTGVNAVDLLTAVYRRVTSVSPPVGFWYVNLQKAFA
jgi:hypothetical protein